MVINESPDRPYCMCLSFGIQGTDRPAVPVLSGTGNDCRTGRDHGPVRTCHLVRVQELIMTIYHGYEWPVKDRICIRCGRPNPDTTYRTCEECRGHAEDDEADQIADARLGARSGSPL